jgi:molybdopterin synthase catalytic subunit
MSDSPFSVQVLFFASFKELTGSRQVELELPAGATVKDLKHQVGRRFPAASTALKTAVVAVNHEFAHETDAVPAGAEVAIFPPVSGGGEAMPTIFAITEAELDLDDLLAQITRTSTGAACIFTGMVRGITTREDPHETTYLEYEAYTPMAEAKMRQVAEEIRSRWPSVEGIAIVQRVGRLYPRTPTVLIACTAAHRDTGVFEAARYGIDRLKEIVPVWKREVSPDGQEWIEGSYRPTPED